MALLASALLLALAASGCGDNNNASNETLPPRPKLTVPNGSVEPSKKRSGTTGQTGAETGGATTQTQSGTGTGTSTGGAAPQQNTGGQGTGQNQGTATPQDTGGAAPGN
ncbi:MAG: hypothetical protein JJE27_06665 [Thermoleophilia bacterium]|nr:hypothetical protein [Thermoleophilia bacterium]